MRSKGFVKDVVIVIPYPASSALTRSNENSLGYSGAAQGSVDPVVMWLELVYNDQKTWSVNTIKSKIRQWIMQIMVGAAATGPERMAVQLSILAAGRKAQSSSTRP
jgi:hypothetical protein